MNSHSVRGWTKAEVIAEAHVWMDEREAEWCEEWEMSEVMESHSQSLTLKPYYIQLWRVDDDE